MRIAEPGIDLIKSFESCRLTAYKDIVGVLTIGYGHTGADVEEGQEITQDEADALLASDLSTFENGVTRALKVTINQNQFDALVSFAYNLGVHALVNSTLFRLVNQSAFDKAALEFVKWDKAGGKVVPGLLRRRTAERDLFLS
jgi:lysozyme